jgi:hypothetical protein
MGTGRVIRAESPAGLAEILEVAGGMKFALADVSFDPGRRRVRIPFERIHPRRESWELHVLGATSLEVDGRKEQTHEYIRALRHEDSGHVVLETVLVRFRIPAASLAVEARCMTEEVVPDFDVSRLPTAIRKEIEERETEIVRLQDRYATADRFRRRVLPFLGGLAGVVVGGLVPVAWWTFVLHGALGAGIGHVMASRRWEAWISGAAAFGMPQAALGVVSSFAAGSSKESAGPGILFQSIVAPMIGLVLAGLNGKMMVSTEAAAWDPTGDAPRKSLDPAFPMRAAWVCALGGAFLFGIFQAPLVVWAFLAPACDGAAAWYLARIQAPAGVTVKVFGGIGIVLGLMAVSGRTIPPAALLIALFHAGAGTFVALRSRREGEK